MNRSEGGAPRGLSPEAFEQIEMDFYEKRVDDTGVLRLIETVKIQRRVLETMFSYFTHVPLRIISTANPVRTAVLDELRSLVYMDRTDLPQPWKT